MSTIPFNSAEIYRKVIKNSKLSLTFFIISLIVAIISPLIWNSIIVDKQEDEQEFIFSMKQKCREEGNKLYQADVKEMGANSLCVPEYSYNKELNTCLYFSCYIAPDGKFMEKWVKDVFTNEEIVMLILLEGKPETMICSECVSSVEEFDRQKEELFNQ